MYLEIKSYFSGPSLTFQKPLDASGANTRAFANLNPMQQAALTLLRTSAVALPIIRDINILLVMAKGLLSLIGLKVAILSAIPFKLFGLVWLVNVIVIAGILVIAVPKINDWILQKINESGPEQLRTGTDSAHKYMANLKLLATILTIDGFIPQQMGMINNGKGDQILSGLDSPYCGLIFEDSHKPFIDPAIVTGVEKLVGEIRGFCRAKGRGYPVTLQEFTDKVTTPAESLRESIQDQGRYFLFAVDKERLEVYYNQVLGIIREFKPDLPAKPTARELKVATRSFHSDTAGAEKSQEKQNILQGAAKLTRVMSAFPAGNEGFEITLRDYFAIKEARAQIEEAAKTLGKLGYPPELERQPLPLPLLHSELDIFITTQKLAESQAADQ